MSATYHLRSDLCLFHADMREALAALPDCCIDAVVTDPPYSIESISKRFGNPGSALAQHGKDGAYTRLSQKFVGVQWDSNIAFEPETWRKVWRVLKPGGHLAVFGFAKRAHRMVSAVEDAGFEIREGVFWVYATGQVRRRENLKSAHESICIARRPLSEPTLQKNLERWGVGALVIDAARGEGDRWPANIVHSDVFAHPWFYNAKANTADRAGSKHPTVKPVALMQWLVRLVTPRGGVVLDPFAGTGTTGVAALAEGCKALLIERESEYVNDVVKRFLLARVDSTQVAA